MSENVHGATLVGLDAHAVEIEARLLRGRMGLFLLSGLPGAAVRESRDRVRSAIQASGLRFPPWSVLVHLAPADLRKEGPLLDLPIALAILAASEQIDPAALSSRLFAGELALDGRLRRVRGMLAIADAARRLGLAEVLLPADGAPHAALAQGARVIPVATLHEAIRYLAGQLELKPAQPALPAESDGGGDGDLAEVRGQEAVKHVLAIAAAGMHNLLLVGPPGSGKTMLARRMCALLPDLDDAASVECTRIRGVVGPASNGRVVRPPFRAPHHTASVASIVGGGVPLRPGELTLAHRGVLFLDEFPEFPRPVIEALRQPLEDRNVTVTRASGSVCFPADLCLVAAMNPCPCGFRGHRRVACRCPESDVQRYMQRVSGPILDRIDLRAEVPAVEITELLEAPVASSTQEWRERIAGARAAQARRFARSLVNGRMTARDVEEHCRLDRATRDLLVLAAERQHLSARGVTRVLKVARTVADLRGAATIGREDLAVALGCRTALV